MQALQGVTVIDLARTRPGQHATTLLAELGAEVIAVGQPGFARRQAGEDPSALWRALEVGRNKRGILIDLRDPRGREVFYRLARRADVVMESFRPGVVQRLGADYETLKAQNPRLIYCSMSGFGQSGPYRDVPAHDINFQGVAGLLPLGPEGVPQAPVNVWADRLATMNTFAAILAALVARERLGVGQYIDIGYLDGAVTVTRLPEDPMVVGRYPCYNVYATADGKYLSLGVREPWFWERLCRFLGKEEWIPHQRPEGALREEMFAVFRDAFRGRTREEWLRLLWEHDIEAGPVHSLEEVPHDPHVRHRELLLEADHPRGQRVWQPGIPYKFSQTPGRVHKPFTLAGQDTEAILQELGYDAQQITQLLADGVVEATPLPARGSSE